MLHTVYSLFFKHRSDIVHSTVYSVHSTVYFLQLYDSYDSTTITQGLLLTSQATNEMRLPAQQFTLSGGQALSPVVRPGYHYTGSLSNMTISNKISKSP